MKYNNTMAKLKGRRDSIIIWVKTNGINVAIVAGDNRVNEYTIALVSPFLILLCKIFAEKKSKKNNIFYHGVIKYIMHLNYSCCKMRTGPNNPEEINGESLVK